MPNEALVGSISFKNCGSPTVEGTFVYDFDPTGESCTPSNSQHCANSSAWANLRLMGAVFTHAPIEPRAVAVQSAAAVSFRGSGRSTSTLPADTAVMDGADGAPFNLTL
jgi:hypothetical protein